MARRNPHFVALTRKAIRIKVAQRRYNAENRAKRIPIPPNDPEAIRQYWKERS